MRIFTFMRCKSWGFWFDGVTFLSVLVVRHDTRSDWNLICKANIDVVAALLVEGNLKQVPLLV